MAYYSASYKEKWTTGKKIGKRKAVNTSRREDVADNLNYNFWDKF